MKPNEFKPGNIVFPKDFENKVIEKPIRIIDRYGEECSFQFYDSGTIPDNNKIECSRLSGIPISNGWLTIFGFKQDHPNNWYKDGIRIEFDVNGDFKSVYFIPEENPIPEYKDHFSVSDLQNLFFERYRESLI